MEVSKLSTFLKTAFHRNLEDKAQTWFNIYNFICKTFNVAHVLNKYKENNLT
jgi:hypothetical protein